MIVGVTGRGVVRKYTFFFLRAGHALAALCVAGLAMVSTAVLGLKDPSPAKFVSSFLQNVAEVSPSEPFYCDNPEYRGEQKSWNKGVNGKNVASLDGQTAIPPESGPGHNPIAYHVDFKTDTLAKADKKTGKIETDKIEKCPEIPVSALNSKQSDWVFIDLRPSGDYSQQHIPGSLNLPFFALKGKEFMKRSTLVLVSEGYNDKAIHNRCQKLRARGFSDVRVLKGGAYAWARVNHAARPVQSIQEQRLFAFASITPKSYYRNQDQIWMLVNATGLLPRTIAALFGVAEEQVIAAGASRQVLAEREIMLRQKSGQDHEAQFTAAYLVLGKNSGDGKESKDAKDKNIPEEFSRLYKVMETERVFYLKGGVVGYQTYLTQHHAMINRNAERNAAKSLCSVN